MLPVRTSSQNRAHDVFGFEMVVDGSFRETAQIVNDILDRRMVISFSINSLAAVSTINFCLFRIFISCHGSLLYVDGKFIIHTDSMFVKYIFIFYFLIKS